jgi:hypothetical protein
MPADPKHDGGPAFVVQKLLRGVWVDAPGCDGTREAAAKRLADLCRHFPPVERWRIREVSNGR